MENGKLFRVRIRQNLAPVKEEAHQLDGKVFRFVKGWIIDDPNSIYYGETTYLPDDPNYPDDCPAWIATGDLEEVKTIQ